MISQRQLFLNHLAQTSEMPLGIEVVSASGMYLQARDGKKYMDLIAGIGVSALGHCHPKVVSAIIDQSQKYLHTLVYGEYVLSPQVELASFISNLLPDPLDTVYFVNSGSEATEGAMKLAKRFTGRPNIVACKNAYHGSTQGAASLMHPKDFTGPFHPLLPGVRHISYNCEVCLDKIDESTACVIIETVQGEAGVKLPRPGYLGSLRKRCSEVGALLILDEIQCGFGRTGTFFAFEQFGIVPDILLLAKGMGGGMPIGAFIASNIVMQSLSKNPPLGHITTFGGHPVSCAASLATAQYLVQGDLIQEVESKANWFKELLVHPTILEVRNCGLMMAIELEDFEIVQKVIQYCLNNGLVTDWFLFNNRSLRIAPPLIIQNEEIEKACSIIIKGLSSI
jgi:acetylornithine/succinyldiaminopimelate/putrescine aminotransferase